MTPTPSTCLRLTIPLFVGLLVSQGLLAQAENKPGDPKPASTAKAVQLPIAVVDIGKASTHTKAAQSGLERLKAMHTSYQTKLNKIADTLTSLEAEMAVLKDSPEKVDRQIDFASLVQRQRISQERYQKEIAKQRLTNDGEIYREVEAAIGELARRRGILLVLRKRAHMSVEELVGKDGDESEARQRQGSQDRLRDVLYTAASIDLTDDLIKYLKG
jgi:Skp family chaperone for outer membrane proteins